MFDLSSDSELICYGSAHFVQGAGIRMMNTVSVSCRGRRALARL